MGHLIYATIFKYPILNRRKSVVVVGQHPSIELLDVKLHKWLITQIDDCASCWPPTCRPNGANVPKLVQADLYIIA